MAPGSSMPGYSCTTEQLASLRQVVGDISAVANICKGYNVTELGEQAAAIRYLAAGSSNNSVEEALSLNTLFVLLSAYLVFIMQAGFALLCAGHVRAKNNRNILLKNVLDCVLGTLSWFLVGNAFAFGEINGKSNPFIGVGDFALSATRADTKSPSSYHVYFFHWAFSAAAATITAGAVAERVAMGGYMGYTLLMTGFVYPVYTHWIWSEWGWLSPTFASPLFRSGAMDFAGGSVVHMVGGTAALIAAYYVGPRLGRFGCDGEVNPDYRNTNGTQVVLGTFLLWFGWYGFNPGSYLTISGTVAAGAVARTAVTTTLATGGGGMAALCWKYADTRIWDVMELCNGILCGLVSVTAGCGLIDPWAGILVGVLSAGVFQGIDRLMLRLQIDDVVAAVPMHGGCGMLGMLFLGFFARKEFVMEFYGASNTAARRWGVFFGGDGTLLAAQVISVLAVIAWVTLLMVPYFWLMRYFNWARVPMEQELEGLDASKYHVITTNELPAQAAPQTKASFA